MIFLTGYGVIIILLFLSISSILPKSTEEFKVPPSSPLSKLPLSLPLILMVKAVALKD
jgi:hypothetical protein